MMALDHSCQAHRHPLVDRGHDLYETPSVAVDALLRVLSLPTGAILDPACRRGAIANVLRAHGLMHRSDRLRHGPYRNLLRGLPARQRTPPRCQLHRDESAIHAGE